MPQWPLTLAIVMPPDAALATPKPAGDKIAVSGENSEDGGQPSATATKGVK